jgi:hypothetical protein
MMTLASSLSMAVHRQLGREQVGLSTCPKHRIAFNQIQHNHIASAASTTPPRVAMPGAHIRRPCTHTMKMVSYRTCITVPAYREVIGSDSAELNITWAWPGNICSAVNFSPTCIQTHIAFCLHTVHEEIVVTI